MNYNDLLVKFVETKKSVTALEAIMLNDFVTFLALEAAQPGAQSDEFCPFCKSYFPTDAVECSHCGFNVHQTPR